MAKKDLCIVTMGKILFMRIFLVLVSCAPSRSQNRILNYTELANISNNILSSPADYEDYSSGVNYQDYSSVFEGKNHRFIIIYVTISFLNCCAIDIVSS